MGYIGRQLRHFLFYFIGQNLTHYPTQICSTVFLRVRNSTTNVRSGGNTGNFQREAFEKGITKEQDIESRDNLDILLVFT